MSKPAARVGDMHTCPMVTPGTPPVPHVGGPIMPPGVPTVLIANMPAATIGNMCTCVGPPDSIILGSMTVLIGGKPAARMGDSTAHGGVIVMGAPTVLIGDVGSPPSAPSMSGFLDFIQGALDVVGLIPGVGEIADGLNAVISLARGDYAGAALSAAAMIPFAGWGATAAKVGRKAMGSSKVAKAVGKAAKALKGKADDAVKAVKNKIPKKCRKGSGHPVNISVGNVYDEIIDFSFPGPIPLIWERAYYSNSDFEGSLGYGWHHSYDVALAIDPTDQSISFRAGDGMGIPFEWIEEGEETYTRSNKMTLSRHKSGYRLTNEEQLIYCFDYDHQHKNILSLNRIEDLNGNNIAFYYDENGHFNKIIDSVGRTLTINTDEKGRILNIYCPSPHGNQFQLISYQYDLKGNQISVQDALQQRSQYKYVNHLIVQITDRTGLSFYYQYDGATSDARCVRTWGDEGVFDHKLIYLEGLTIVENSLGNKTLHYHEDGIIYRTVDPAGKISSMEYNEYNELVAEVDEVGLTTKYEYDKRGKRTKIIQPDGNTTELKYKKDKLVKAVDSIGGKWQWTYDKKGKVKERTDSLGRKTLYVYTRKGLLDTIQDAAGAITKLGYDAQSNLSSLTTPDGAVSSWKYDLLGNLIEKTDAKGNKQIRKYDLLKQVRHVTEPDGNVRWLDYDGEGNVLRAKDQQHDIKFGYKGYHKLGFRTEANTTVEFIYNTEDELIGIKNEHNSLYTFVLDEKGQVQIEKGFDGTKREFFRDAAGKVVAVKRPDGRVTEYDYDAMGRVIGVNYPDETKETFQYRADGALMEANNEAIKVQVERDLLGRITKETQGEYEVNSAYDVMGMRSQVTSSLGAKLDFSRNVMGDVEQVTSKLGNQSYETYFKRDILGLETERQFGKVKSEWTRDWLGRPLKQETTTSAGAPLRIRTYKWEVNDRLRQITDPFAGTTTFEHDEFGNLAAAQNPDGTFDFRTPDAVGNLFKTKDRKDRKYGPAGQLLEANGTKYTYDAEGNLIIKTTPKGIVWQYEWTASGMLNRVVRPDGNTVTFKYDALGRRISKTYLGKTTRWVWDGNTPLHEWVIPAEDYHLPVKQHLSPESFLSYEHRDKDRNATTDAAVVTTWIFEPDSFSPMAKMKGDQYFGIISDHLGTPVAMLDEAGRKVWAADTNIYGQLKNVQGEAAACPFRYPGQYEDEETGLYYNRFRYYDSEGGIYLSQDPIGLKSGEPNFYRYVPDTNILVDIFGLSCPKNKKTSYEASSRRDAFRQAKRDANIPKNQQPTKVDRANLDDGNGNKILGDNGQPVQAREYHFTNNKGDNVVIQEHSLGHTKATAGHGAESHFNVRPANNTRTGHVEGTHGHYNF